MSDDGYKPTMDLRMYADNLARVEAGCWRLQQRWTSTMNMADGQPPPDQWRMVEYVIGDDP